MSLDTEKEVEDAVAEAKQHFEYGQPKWLQSLLRTKTTLTERVTQLEEYIVAICQEKALQGAVPSMITEAIRLKIPALDLALFENMEGEVTPLQKAKAELETLKKQHEELRESAAKWLRQRDLAFDREEALVTLMAARTTDGECPECGQLTQRNAGDPGRWPVLLPTPTEPGQMKTHHIACVLAWKNHEAT